VKSSLVSTRRNWVPLFEQAFKNSDDILWKEAGCTTELDYTEQTSWILFLKYLEDLEQDKSTEAALEGKRYLWGYFFCGRGYFAEGGWMALTDVEIRTASET
jgi:hypothetical protein